jgi:hypothetical protein
MFFVILSFLALVSRVLGEEFPDAAMKVLVPQSFDLPRKGAVDPRNEMKTEVLRVGPFDVAGNNREMRVFVKKNNFSIENTNEKSKKCIFCFGFLKRWRGIM